jgi:hypothetical protein
MAATLGDKVVDITTALPYGNDYSGYRQANDYIFLVPFVALKGGWYWERLDDLYYPGSYIALTDTLPSPGTMVIDGNITQDIGTLTRVHTYHAGSGVPAPNRLSPSDKIANLNQAAFWKTAHYSPISELVNNVLYIYRDDSFTVNGTDCELPEGMHEGLCDMGIEYMKGNVGDIPGMQVAKADIAERVII